MPYFTDSGELNDLQIIMNDIFLIFHRRLTKTFFDEMSRWPQGTRITMTISGPIIVQTWENMDSRQRLPCILLRDLHRDESVNYQAEIFPVQRQRCVYEVSLY